MTALPNSVRQFVEQQTTVPIAELGNEVEAEPVSPYGSYWYRAVACMLLSGRVSPKIDGHPNFTDVTRACKEANFNQHLAERIGRLLTAAGALQAERSQKYVPGPNLPAFWAQDFAGLQEGMRQAVHHLAESAEYLYPWHYRSLRASSFLDFLTLFYAAFQGRAMPAAQVGPAFRGLCTLPPEDLARAAEKLGLADRPLAIPQRKSWLDEKERRAFLRALYDAEWACAVERGKGAWWWFSSSLGLATLGLARALPAPPLSTDLRVQPDAIIFAGAGLPVESLVTLFRYCRMQRIAEVFEFQVEKKRLALAPSGADAGAEVRAALEGAGPLPSALEGLLATESKLGGNLEVRWCSALVKPESKEVLAAIRKHPQLKNYIEAGAPSGYLLIKAASRPDNFVARCRALGFKIEIL